MQFIYKGGDVHYYINDNIGDKVTVLLHGWGANAQAVMCLSAGIAGKVIGIDFPPFGLSNSPTRTFVLSDYTDIVVQCLKECGVNKATFIGHSFGGRVCIDIASRTDLAEKIVLIDSAGIKPKRTIAKRINSIKFKFAKLFKKDTKKYYSSDYLALDDSMKKTFANIVSFDLKHKLKHIKCDTLIIWGKDDKDTPLYMAKKLKKHIAKSELIVLDGEHFCYLDNLREVRLIIQSFLGS